MPLEVIGAGFGRTGTLTLKTALERLGFGPCYHMSECSANAETHVPFWTAAARGGEVDWDAFFAGYRATTDWPACDFYRELVERYPDAKVILSLRDPRRWYESVAGTIYPTSRRPRPDRASSWREMVEELIWQGTFAGRFEEMDAAVEVFERHNAEVARTVPPERLLEYRVQDGWEPLCAFLGVPVPKEPFPHANERQAFLADLRRRGVELD